MSPQPYTKDDLAKGEQIVREMHGLKGYDAWAERIAKALAAEREASALASDSGERPSVTQDELIVISNHVAALGEHIEQQRRRVADAIVGRVAVSTSGRRFRVQRVTARFSGRSCRLWTFGPILKRDGTPHARIEDSCPIENIAREPKL